MNDLGLAIHHYPGLPVFVNKEHVRRVLRDDFTRRERFRLWAERLADRAGLHWPCRRVTRTREEELDPIFAPGIGFFMGPRAYRAIQEEVDE